VTPIRKRSFHLAALLGIALAAGGCGSSSGPVTPTIGSARTYSLASFEPAGTVTSGKPTQLSFTIQQPSGKPLTDYRRGSGPHTGVHVILVRSDLDGGLIHTHPPVAADGHIAETVEFPTPGRYRLVVDAYPGTGPQRNFQLFRWLTVAGTAPKDALPPFEPTATVDGYRFILHGRPRLRAIQPKLLDITVARPDGSPARFTPWYGALAHAIFFRAGTLDYFHTHVCGAGASAACGSILGSARVTGHSVAPGKLTVGVLVPVSGTWRLFLQTRVDGRVLTAPFTLRVA
jgi:hypothetical protein